MCQLQSGTRVSGCDQAGLRHSAHNEPEWTVTKYQKYLLNLCFLHRFAIKQVPKHAYSKRFLVGYCFFKVCKKLRPTKKVYWTQSQCFSSLYSCCLTKSLFKMCARNYPVHSLASNHNWNMMTKFSTTQKIQFYEHPILLRYEQNGVFTLADKCEQVTGRRFAFFVTNAQKKKIK